MCAAAGGRRKPTGKIKATLKASEEKGDKAKAKYLEIAKVRASIAFTLAHASVNARACMHACGAAASSHACSGHQLADTLHGPFALYVCLLSTRLACLRVSKPSKGSLCICARTLRTAPPC